MKKEPERLEMDLVKIFLTPPNTMKEKITLILMMVVVFVMIVIVQLVQWCLRKFPQSKELCFRPFRRCQFPGGGWYYSGVCSEKENFLRLRIRR